MTWFRVDVGIGDHELVGAIAEGLGVHPDTALALYIRTLSGFAEYHPDGVVKTVTNITLEEWAKWRGEPGKFAAFFRARCVETRRGQKDAPGVVKGWWRNAKLLEKQLRDRNRPGQGTREAERARERPQGALGVPFGGNGNVDVNKQMIDNSARVRELLDKLPPEGASALEGYLRAAQDPERLCMELESYLSGLHGPGGRAVTPEQLGRALHDMALAGARATSRVIAAFVQGVIEPARARGKKAPADLAGWVERKERQRAPAS